LHTAIATIAKYKLSSVLNLAQRNLIQKKAAVANGKHVVARIWGKQHITIETIKQSRTTRNQMTTGKHISSAISFQYR
jgi:hypothetical protein